MAWPSPNEIGLPAPSQLDPSTRDIHEMFQDQLHLSDSSTLLGTVPSGYHGQQNQQNCAPISHQQHQPLQPQRSQESLDQRSVHQQSRPPSSLQQPQQQPQQQQQMNVIHYAASQGFVDMVRKVLTANANELELVDQSGNTPLLLAAINGHHTVVEFLLEFGANINALNDFDNTSIHETAWRGYSRSLELLCRARSKLYMKNKQGHTPLHLAAQKGHNQCTRILLRTGCKPNIKNNFGDTPLHSASRYGHCGVVRILISAFANVNDLNKNDDTALHIASAMGRKKLAKILLESGCNPTVVNKQGETPMNIALRKQFHEIQELIVSPPPLKPIHLKQQELYIRPFQGSFKDIYCALPPDSGQDDQPMNPYYVHHHTEEHHRTRSHERERRHRSNHRHRTLRRSSRGCKSDYSHGQESEVHRRKSPYNDHSDSDEEEEEEPEDDEEEISHDKSQYPRPKLETLPTEPLQMGEQYFVDATGRIHKGTQPGVNQLPLATILGEPVVGRRHMRPRSKS